MPPPELPFDPPPFDLIDDYLRHLAETLDKISRQDILAVIQVLFHAWRERRFVYVIGNGGSAATASHIANDLCKLTAVPGKPRFKTFALTDNVPLLTAWANDSDYSDIFAEPLRNFLQPGDLVIAISASGNSSNILKAMQVAKSFNAVCIAFTGNDGGKLRHLVDYCIRIPDDHMGRQEDGHMILDHVIANTLRAMIAQSAD